MTKTKKTQDEILAGRILSRLTRESKLRPNGWRPGTKIPVLIKAIVEELERSRETGKPKAEAIYDAYPRKIGRQNALKAISNALKAKSYEHLLERTQAYAAAVLGWSPDYRYSGSAGKDIVPYPASWFNAGRYDDDPGEWQGDKRYNQPAATKAPEEIPMPENWQQKFLTWSKDPVWQIDGTRIHNTQTGKRYGWKDIPADVRKELYYGKAS